MVKASKPKPAKAEGKRLRILVVEDKPMELGKKWGDIYHEVHKKALADNDELSKLQKDYHANDNGRKWNFQKLQNYLSAVGDYMQKKNGWDVTEDYLNVAREMLQGELSDKFNRDVDVDIALDVRGAMKMLDEGKYDLVISDLGLPYVAKITGSRDSILYNEGIEKISPGLEKIINRANLNKKRKEFSEQGVNFPDNLDSSKNDMTLRDPWVSAGNVVINKAKERGFPVYAFTDTGHYLAGIIGGIVGGNINLEQAKDIFGYTPAFKNFKTEWGHIDSDRLSKDKFGFANTGNIYIGDKNKVGIYPKVIHHAISQEFDKKRNRKK